jgi:glucose-6-phosphate 1-dehydrogenase
MPERTNMTEGFDEQGQQASPCLVNMEFDYTRDFGRSHSTGYERLMYDCMMGDATLFQRADMVEAGWKVIQPVLDV